MYKCLFVIILIAFFLRLFSLDKNPPGLDWDEVATGYNAYSITLTQKDEYGKFLPILFESFNDYKHPGYIYSLVPFIRVFGLSDFVVRLPSALYGIATILVTFFLSLHLGNQIFSKSNLPKIFALLAAFLLTISPWHLQFSRVAFEGIGAVFFYTLGLLFLLKSRQNFYYLYFSSIVFGLSFYFYYPSRLVAPLMLLATLFFLKNRLRNKKKYFIFVPLLLIFITLPILITDATNGNQRVSQLNIFTNQENLQEINQKRVQDNNNLSALFHNKPVDFGLIFVKNYLRNFSLEFLFLSGDSNGRHGPKHMGLLYLSELPFLIIGLYFLLQRSNFYKRILLAQFLLAPLPAAFSIQSPHALRSLLIVPTAQIIIAFGVICFFNSQTRKKLRKTLLLLFSLMLCFNFSQYLDSYYYHTPKATAFDWADGHRQLWEYLSSVSTDYDKIIIGGEYWQPYIFGLYYLKFDPKTYQKNWNHAHFGKYYFKETLWDRAGARYYKNIEDTETLQKNTKTLVIVKHGVLKDSDVNKTIYNSFAEPVFDTQEIL